MGFQNKQKPASKKKRQNKFPWMDIGMLMESLLKTHMGSVPQRETERPGNV